MVNSYLNVCSLGISAAYVEVILVDCRLAAGLIALDSKSYFIHISELKTALFPCVEVLGHGYSTFYLLALALWFGLSYAPVLVECLCAVDRGLFVSGGLVDIIRAAVNCYSSQ